jgi:transcription elongation factor Elf1
VNFLFGPRIECSRCGKSFRLNLRDVPLDDAGVRREFTCSHCGLVYVVATISARGVEIISELTTERDPERVATLQAEMAGEVVRAGDWQK